MIPAVVRDPDGREFEFSFGGGNRRTEGTCFRKRGEHPSVTKGTAAVQLYAIQRGVRRIRLAGRKISSEAPLWERNLQVRHQDAILDADGLTTLCAVVFLLFGGVRHCKVRAIGAIKLFLPF